MIYSSFDLEKNLWLRGFKLVCGIDEVGRGCFAGPVVIGAVIFPKDFAPQKKLADSKLLKPKQREFLAKFIKETALYWSIAEISVRDINKFGIGKATQMGFRKAVKLLTKKPDFVLIDAFHIKHFNRKNQKPIKDGDKISASISAASIIAKVYRDRLMKGLHKKYPQYKLSKNKGYGTRYHQEAIKKYGLTKIHRTSFNLKQFINN